MPASIVIGQADFSSNNVNRGGTPGANTLSDRPRSILVDSRGRLIVSDSGNHRILIWNSVPMRNDVPADLVLGQPDFNTVTANTGGISASTLSTPSQIASDGTRFFVADTGNNRVLIWNTLPTTNQQPADVVVGQTSMSALVSACSASNLYLAPHGVAVYGNKLLISAGGNPTGPNRILIWNSIPTVNGASADLVLGQPDFSTCTAPATSANTFKVPYHMTVDDRGKLYVADNSNHRYLIWNSFPTSNNVPADVVVGQSDFTSGSPSVSASRVSFSVAPVVANDRLFVGDGGNNRYLIFNTIPSGNGVGADIVLGQTNFLNNSDNQGGSPAANTISSPDGLFVYQRKFIVADGPRILIYTDDDLPPTLGLYNVPESRGGNVFRMYGTARVGDPYTIKSVEYAVNGSPFSGATATDGYYGSSIEDFFFDFLPTTNQQKDGLGRLIDGYSLRIRSINSNAQLQDNLFYFSPFEQDTPSNHAFESFSFPTFSFHVHKNRIWLSENLAKYQIQVRRNTESSWHTYSDNIPIDFRLVKDSIENKQRAIYGHLNSGNGVYETNKMLATYLDDSARISVRQKDISLSGTYQWKVVAVDKAGHTQETGVREITVGTASLATNTLPIALLSITGVSNRLVQSNIMRAFTTYSVTPTFYGIAWGGSEITLRLSIDGQTKLFTTRANAQSRFGINVPKGVLVKGKTYTVTVSSALGDKYNETAPFILAITDVR